MHARTHELSSMRSPEHTAVHHGSFGSQSASSKRALSPGQINQDSNILGRLGPLLQRNQRADSNNDRRSCLDVISQKDSISSLSPRRPERRMVNPNIASQLTTREPSLNRQNRAVASNRQTFKRQERTYYVFREQRANARQEKAVNFSYTPPQVTLPPREPSSYQPVSSNVLEQQQQRNEDKCPPNFQALFAVVGQNAFDFERGKEIVQMFVDFQIAKHIQVNSDLSSTFEETKITQKLTHLFKNYAQQMYAEGKMSRNYQLVAQQIWRHLFDVQTIKMGKFFKTFQKQSSNLPYNEMMEMGDYVKKQFDSDHESKEKEAIDQIWGSKNQSLSQWTNWLQQQKNIEPIYRRRQSEDDNPETVIYIPVPEKYKVKAKILAKQNVNSDKKPKGSLLSRIKQNIKSESFSETDTVSVPNFSSLKKRSNIKSQKSTAEKFTTDKTQNGMKIKYTVTLLWFETKTSKKPVHKEKYPEIYTVTVFSNEMNIIEQQIASDVQRCFKKLYQEGILSISSELVKSRVRDGYDLTVEIKNIIFNMPKGYSWSGKLRKGTIYSDLVIQNQYGSIQWLDQIDLGFVDFKKDMTIQSRQVEFFNEQLEKCCQIKMWGLPGQLVDIPNKHVFKMISNNFRKMGATLLQIDKDDKNHNFFIFRMFEGQVHPQ